MILPKDEVDQEEFLRNLEGAIEVHREMQKSLKDLPPLEDKVLADAEKNAMDSLEILERRFLAGAPFDELYALHRLLEYDCFVAYKLITGESILSMSTTSELDSMMCGQQSVSNSDNLKAYVHLTELCIDSMKELLPDAGYDEIDGALARLRIAMDADDKHAMSIEKFTVQTELKRLAALVGNEYGVDDLGRATTKPFELKTKDKKFFN